MLTCLGIQKVLVSRPRDVHGLGWIVNTRGQTEPPDDPSRPKRRAYFLNCQPNNTISFESHFSLESSEGSLS